MESLSLAKIRTDGGTQMRVAISNETLLDYRDKWKSGVEFDPIDVFYDGVTYWLADGFHRFYGAREAKRKDIPATIHNGTVRDAILFACGANTAHGLRRTNADKRQSVSVLLADEEWSGWSDRVIAEKCGVSNPFVSEIRSQLLTVNNTSTLPKRKGKDGKEYKSTKPQTAVKPATEKPESNGTILKDNGGSVIKAGGGLIEPRITRDITPLDKLKEYWLIASDVQRCVFRDWIEQNP